MKNFRYVLGAVLAAALAVAIIPNRGDAQNASFPLGFAVASATPSAYQPTLAAGGSLSATSSGLVVTIEGGNVRCPQAGSGTNSVATSSLTLLANTTYLIVYNCPMNLLYAKTAVTAPGGQSGTTAPGTPGTFLAAIPGVELSVAKAVTGASTVTLTDMRSAASFDLSHLSQPIANTDQAGTKAAAAGVMTYTFANAWQSAPVCMASDQTTAAALKVATTTTTLTVSGATTTDSIAYACFGNPN